MTLLSFSHQDQLEVKHLFKQLFFSFLINKYFDIEGNIHRHLSLLRLEKLDIYFELIQSSVIPSVPIHYSNSNKQSIDQITEN